MLECMYSPFTKITYILTFFPSNSLSELSEVPSPWLQSYFVPVQFSSVAQLFLTLCNLIDCSTPDFFVYHQLLELTQTHVHRVSDAIQPSHSLSCPSPPAFNLSQHQGLFQWVSSLHLVAKNIGVSASTPVLPMNTQDWSPLGWTGWISLQSKELSRVFSNPHHSNSVYQECTPVSGSVTYTKSLIHRERMYCNLILFH